MNRSISFPKLSLNQNSCVFRVHAWKALNVLVVILILLPNITGFAHPSMEVEEISSNQGVGPSKSSPVLQENEIKERSFREHSLGIKNTKWDASINANFDTSGTIKHDLTMTNSPTLVVTPIPSTTPTPTPTEPPETEPQLLFVDGFESGDLSQWSANSTGDGNLSVSSTAALSGIYGMQAVIDDNDSLYVQDDTPDGEIYYRASFEFDPNNISMSNGNAHEILVVYSETSEAILNIHLRYSGGYRISISFIDNQGNTTSSGWYTINDGIHEIAFLWWGTIGYIALTIDGNQKTAYEHLDIDNLGIDFVRLGAVDRIDNGTRGTYFFDTFESWHWPNSNPEPSDTPTPTATFTPTDTATSTPTSTPSDDPTDTPTSTPTPTLQFSNTGFMSPNSQDAGPGGDGNGFEVNPSYAFLDNGNFAVDNSSGTNTGTDCNDSGKDNHIFYDFNLNIPADAIIQGIEVRLDAWADDTFKNPGMCVELSWDGGNSWTDVDYFTYLETSEDTYYLGGSQDTWEHTWNVSKFSNTNFRLMITNVAEVKVRDFYLDWVAVDVHYTQPAAANKGSSIKHLAAPVQVLLIAAIKSIAKSPP